MKTLTAQDRDKALSKGKRKRVERAPKILLCNPFPKYWPRINEEDAIAVNSLLHTSLVRERGRHKVPWKKLVHLSKMARKKQMKEINSREVISDALLKQRKYLKVGLNAVARAIHHRTISSCLLAGDASPDFLISHLVTLAATRGIPILIVPSLKDSVSKTLGFSATALGITVKNDSECLKSLDELIKKLSSQFPVPFHFTRIRQNTNINKNKSVKNAHEVVSCTTDDRKDEGSSDVMIGDFFIDVTPGPSACNVVYSDETTGTMKSDTEFILLDSVENQKQSEERSNQLHEDYVNNLLYIAPKFTRMQKNCNRQSGKKLLQI